MMYLTIYLMIGLIKHSTTLKIKNAELREKSKNNSLGKIQWYRQIFETFSDKKMEVKQTKETNGINKIRQFSNVPNTFLNNF